MKRICHRVCYLFVAILITREFAQVRALQGSKKVSRNILYHIQPASSSALASFTSADKEFVLNNEASSVNGVIDSQFQFGSKTPKKIENLVQDQDASSSSSSSSQSEENSQNLLKLEPSQIQQILKLSQIQHPSRLTLLKLGHSPENSDIFKTAQSRVITADRLHQAASGYSERRQKKGRKSKSSETPKDASYAFGYETEDATRHEVADPSGNVKGWYTYVDDEGTLRKIVYTAGADQGFVVLKKEKVRNSGNSGGGKKSKSRKGGGGGSGRNRGDGGSRGGNSDYDSFARNGYQKGSGGATPTNPSRPNFYNNENLNDLAKSGTSNPIFGRGGDGGGGSKGPKTEFSVKIRRPADNEYDDDSSNDSNGDYDGNRGGGGGGGGGNYQKGGYSSPEYDESDENRQRGGGGNKGGGGGIGGAVNVKGDTDSSYLFGYETDTANRLEKADGNGNVRGSYSYIDKDTGEKRTVHYIAGADTGFQVINASPSVSRDVRVKAPPGFHGSGNRNKKEVSSILKTSETKFPIPSAIVYHIHSDSPTSTWDVPVTYRKKVKVSKTIKLPKGIIILQDSLVTPTTAESEVVPEKDESSVDNYIETVSIAPKSSPIPTLAPSPSTNPYFKEKVTLAVSGDVTQKETQFPSPTQSSSSPPPSKSRGSRRRHAPQRGYTGDHQSHDISHSYENEVPSQPTQSYLSVHDDRHRHTQEPLVYSPTFESETGSAQTSALTPTTSVGVAETSKPPSRKVLKTSAVAGHNKNKSKKNKGAINVNANKSNVQSKIASAIKVSDSDSVKMNKDDDNGNDIGKRLINRLRSAAGVGPVSSLIAIHKS